MTMKILTRAMGLLRQKRGVSIIGTLFTLIILGVLGAALVSMVGSEQDSRMKSIRRELGFYAVQAGLEYALREINEGGYPLVYGKQLGDAQFSVAINPSLRKITVTGSAGENARVHSITTSQLAADCAAVDTSGMSVGGASLDKIQGIVVRKTCLNGINVKDVRASWTPDIGEKIMQVSMDSALVYDDLNGTLSGSVTDITDKKITTSSLVNYIDFSGSVSGKSVTLTFDFTDSSSITKNITLP